MTRDAVAARTHLVLLVGLIVSLGVQPLLVEASAMVATLADIVIGGLCLAIFLSLGRQPSERRTGLLLFVPVLASNVVLHVSAGRAAVVAVVFHAATAAFLGFAVFVVVRLLTRTAVIGLDEVFGAVGGYMLAALAWSHGYALAYLTVPGSLSINPEIAAQVADWRSHRVLFDHLSFTTLTTIGYSDITPVGSPMYALVWSETIFGQFYMAVVVAQLVGLKLAQALQKPGA